MLPRPAGRCRVLAASATMRASLVGRGILQRCDATAYENVFGNQGTGSAARDAHL